MEHVKRIYEALLNRKEKVCHKEEIVDVINEYIKEFKAPISIVNTIKYLSRHRYTKRIFKSFYYINSIDERKRGFCYYEDRELLFIVLKKLGVKWYIGLNSALYLSGKKWQVSRILHILNNKFCGKRNILSLKVHFFKVKESLFFGLNKTKTENKIRYPYSNPVKTYLDMMYLRKIDSLPKDKKIKNYLKYYPKWVGKR